jgi:hypothetical protein
LIAICQARDVNFTPSSQLEANTPKIRDEEGNFTMDATDTVKGFIRNPREWAADCEAQVGFDIEPEARAAFQQLAEEFEAAASEIDGLIAAFEALSKRRRAPRLSA